MNEKQKRVAQVGKSWQKTKSEQTKTAILNAALDCFLSIGFNNTTTEKIAKQAKVSRGAMLHHFPQRLDLIRASVQHLHRKRLEAFEETLSKLNENADFTLVGEGIDAFWDQLQSPLFAVYCELLVASRTDAELKGMLAPAIIRQDDACPLASTIMERSKSHRSSPIALCVLGPGALKRKKNDDRPDRELKLHLRDAPPKSSFPFRRGEERRH